MSSTSIDLEKEQRRISFLIDNYKKGNELINSAILIDSRQNVLDFKRANEKQQQKIINNKDITEFMESSYFESFCTSDALFEAIEGEGDVKFNHTIYYFSKFLGANYENLGVLIIGIDANKFFEYTEIYCREIFDASYVVTGNDKVIYSSGPFDFISEVKSNSIKDNLFGLGKVMIIEGERYLIFEKYFSSNTDWRLIGLISYQKLIKDVKIITTFIYFIGIICIIAVSIVSSYIAKAITDPIIKINMALLKLESGEWPDPVKVNSEDELKSLVSGINKTIESLKKMIENIYKEETEKKQAEIKAVHFQLELLQSQINPHFIYNTLNTFSFLALKSGNEKLRELIQSFDRLLRSSISTESNFVTIEEELDLTQKYVEIQRCRYSNIYDIIYQVDKELLSYKIPKLILQPLVENALYHGIIPKGIEGIIKVEMLKQDDCIQVRVIDNGVGISENCISEILSGKRTKKTKGFSNIGLTNINDRLKLYFGDYYMLHIKSGIDGGTMIVFCIPYVN
jgi:two-component system sensor histidine kinase YesM